MVQLSVHADDIEDGDHVPGRNEMESMGIASSAVHETKRRRR